MTPEQFSAQMRQARLQSPLRTREAALKQFAEVEAYLHRHALQPKSKPCEDGPKEAECCEASKS